MSCLWRWWRQVPARQGSLGMAPGTGTACPVCSPTFLARWCRASHPSAWPLDTSLQPKGCPFPPHHCRCACTCSSHKPSPWWQDGHGDGGGEHPQSPSLERKKESCWVGKIPPCEAGTLPATPGRAVAPRRRDGSASTEHLRGGWLPVGGGWGGCCPQQSLHPSWEVQAGPWGAGDVLLRDP